MLEGGGDGEGGETMMTGEGREGTGACSVLLLAKSSQKVSNPELVEV